MAFLLRNYIYTLSCIVAVAAYVPEHILSREIIIAASSMLFYCDPLPLFCCEQQTLMG